MNRACARLRSLLWAGSILGLLAGCGGGSSSSGGGTFPAPTGETATSADSGEVTLDWDLVAGATSYNLYWDTATGVAPETGTKISGIFPPYNQTGLANGTTYYYVVTAQSGVAEGLPSGEVSSTPLSPPANVSAAGGSTQVTLSWSSVTGATSYNIYWSNSAGLTKRNGIIAAGVSSPYTHFGLTDGMTYFYVVTAANPGGGGAESSESTAAFAMPLSPPTGLGSLGGTGWVLLDWTGVTEATSYNIYWSTTSGVTSDTGNRISGEQPPYIHAGLSNGTTYYYVVTAVDLVGDGAESNESNETSATPDLQGVLDSSFNGVGFATHHDAAGGALDDQALDVITDASGRVLIAGESVNASGNYDMAIWRYAADGTLDTTFNSQGWVVHDGAAGGAGSDSAQGIALDASGRILAVGYSVSTALNLDLVLWRYNDDGALDTTFNSQGWVVQDNGGGGGDMEYGMDLILDATGRIVVTGGSTTTAGGEDMTIWRFNADGTLDTTFNSQGWVVHDGGAGGAGGSDSGRAVTLDGSGKIVTTGLSWSSLLNDDMAIWRYNPDGTLDTGFNSQGWVTHDSAAGGAGMDAGASVATDGTDRILVTGTSEGGTFQSDMAIWRYNSDGTLDTTFNSQGWATHDSAGGGNDADGGEAVVVDASGRILVGGWSLLSPSSVGMAIWRYSPDGTLDTAFNSQGWFLHDAPTTGPTGDQGLAMTLDASGRVLVAGRSYTPIGDYDMVVWRVR